MHLLSAVSSCCHRRPTVGRVPAGCSTNISCRWCPPAATDVLRLAGFQIEKFKLIQQCCCFRPPRTCAGSWVRKQPVRPRHGTVGHLRRAAAPAPTAAPCWCCSIEFNGFTQSKTMTEEHPSGLPDQNTCNLCGMERLLFEPPPRFCALCFKIINSTRSYYLHQIFIRLR